MSNMIALRVSAAFLSAPVRIDILNYSSCRDLGYIESMLPFIINHSQNVNDWVFSFVLSGGKPKRCIQMYFSKDIMFTVF